MTETDLTGLSYSQLRERTAAVDRELQRRAEQDQAQRAEQFRAELDAVRGREAAPGRRARALAQPTRG